MKAMLINVISLVTAFTVMVLASLAYSQGLSIELVCLAAYDPYKVAQVTHLVCKVRNMEANPIRPVFFINNGVDKKNWNVVTGSTVLEPNAESLYILETPDATVAISPHRRFSIEVRDLVTGKSFAKIMSLSEIPHVNISNYRQLRNPYFKYWTYDVQRNMKYPFGWDVTCWKEHPMETCLMRYDEGGVYLEVGQPLREHGNWLMSGIQQLISLPDKIRVKVKPMFSTPVSQNPLCVSGIEIADRSLRLWILFTTDVDRPTILERKGDLHYALVYYPVKIGEVNEIIVDVAEIYKVMQWSLPAEHVKEIDGLRVSGHWVNLLAFVAAYPGCPLQRLEAYFYTIET